MLVGCVTDLKQIDSIKAFVDLIELRLDYFELEKRPDFPCIFTLRKKEQGGKCDLSEEKRLAKIEKALEMQPEYCDIEADTPPHFIEKIAKKFPKVKLIGSYHNFQKTPEDLNALLEGMKNPCFSVYKIALKAGSTPDMLRLMFFARDCKEDLSVISMGEFGRPSRVLGPIVGNVFDYAGLEEDEDLQRYSLKALHEVFHYRRLNQNTQVYSLIGDPIEKSPSDLFHNSKFQHNAVYVKMRIRPDELQQCFHFFRKLAFKGLSVTIPLKEDIVKEMDEIMPAAKEIGAINTVIFKEGKCIGTNTDGVGALNAIERYLPVKDRRIAILGAGGTARAIAYESKKRGAKVLIFNRTESRAQRLAKEFQLKAFPLKDLERQEYDILVNTVPPNAMDTPAIRPHTVVMDVVYDPKITPLLARAKELHCQCIYGEEMFVEQALLQQKEWHYTIRKIQKRSLQ